mmetsp:Transcript_7118/g.14403  ORF Transcript_7118/g.14403 Transcript_7118/m.14403 type:complete len:214 (+) Transcript_7118:2485-3126(+)
MVAWSAFLLLSVFTFSSMRPSCLNACSHTSRASGSDTSTRALSRAGSSSGKKAAASIGCSTSLDMFATIFAHWRLMAVFFSLKPRDSRGTIMARAEPSTVWTKVQDARAWMVSGTWEMLDTASMMVGITFSISLLPMATQHFCMVTLACTFTASVMSTMQADTTGTISGRHWATWVGLDSASFCRVLRAPTTVGERQELSMDCSSLGTTVLVA